MNHALCVMSDTTPPHLLTHIPTHTTSQKFNLKLPDEVDEYYTIKDKCIAAGWVPGQTLPPGQQPAPNGPHRVMAQALMKRCIADIPIVTHIQKESTGMNKLYAQSMCSVNQWRSYQMAESLVSAEVDEVRAEADEIEPGWSQVSLINVIVDGVVVGVVILV